MLQRMRRRASLDRADEGVRPYMDGGGHLTYLPAAAQNHLAEVTYVAVPIRDTRGRCSFSDSASALTSLGLHSTLGVTIVFRRVWIT